MLIEVVTDPKRVGELLRAIDAYNGQPATEAAFRLAPIRSKDSGR